MQYYEYLNILECSKDQLMQAEKKFTNVPNYFYCLTVNTTPLEFVVVRVINLGLIDYKSPMTQTPANSNTPKAIAWVRLTKAKKVNYVDDCWSLGMD